MKLRIFFIAFTSFILSLSLPTLSVGGAENNALENAASVVISDIKLSKKELELLRSKPLVVGYSHTHQPLSYLGNTKKPRGIIVDIFSLLAKEYDFEIQFKSLDNLTAESESSKKPIQADIILPIVENSEIDFSNFILTKTYLSLPLLIFTLNDTNDLSTYRNTPSTIVLYDYIFVDMDKIRADFKNKTFSTFKNYKDVFVAYNEGKVDALMATDTSLYFNQYIVYKTKQLTNNTHELAVYETKHSVDLRAYVSKSLNNYTGYVSVFNRLFAGLNQHIINDIKLVESQKFYPDLSIIDFLSQHYYTLVAGFIAVLFLTVSLVLYLNNRKKSEILKVANIDKTTGLYSKHKFFTDISAKLKNAKSGEYQYVTVRFDNFPVINEMFSYEKGTQAMIAISDVFKNNFKDRNVLMAREKPINFSFFCKADTALNLQDICENDLNDAVREVLSHSYELKVSIGKYVIENPKDSVEEISNRVRLAVKKGLTNYKNTFTVFDNHMQQAEKMSYDIVFRMKEALSSKEFYAVYQPKIDLQTMKILGAEALVRWQPEGNPSPIYPNEFIPLFEENGFIVELDLFVFEEACRFMNLNRTNFPLLKISVNMSPVTLFSSNINSKALEILNKYGLSAKHVIIELTESATLLDPTSIMRILYKLKEDGFEISIDDFGTGLSSLNRLGTLDADEIKLDKDFLDIGKNEIKKILVVQDIVAMIKRLGIRVVCEGVETKDHALWLKDIGCTIGQGYYFAKPMREKEFRNALLSPDKSQVIPPSPEAMAANHKNKNR